VTKLLVGKCVKKWISVREPEQIRVRCEINALQMLPANKGVTL